MKTPDYSPYAKQYAKSRPGYPEELFKYLASLIDNHNVAWDCATGSGQAALSLVKYFDKVIATDVSREQIKNAVQHSRIEFRVCPSENSGISDNSVNLITAASAVHWFNLPEFYREAKRVMAAEGVIAVWTYHVGYIEPPFNDLFLRFYRDILSPYFSEGARLVDNRYADIVLPGKQIESKNLFVSVKWKLSDMFNFIESWSGTQEYRKRNGENPVSLIETDLRKLWGNPQQIHTLRWPIFIKIARM